MKKFLSIFLIFTLVFSIMPASIALAADQTTQSEDSYETMLEEFAEDVRSGMRNRDGVVFLYYQSSEPLDENFWTDMESLIFAETDNPKDGDYLTYQYDTMSTTYSASVEDGVYYHYITYHFTYYTTAEQETAVDEAVISVLDELGITLDTSNYDKVKIIYDYICDHVTYDYDHLSDDTYTLKATAYAALIDGTSVCQGYANLFYRLAKEVGLDVRIVSGTGNGEAHAWNIVKLGSSYYHVDATWDAGQSSYSYFLKGSDEFDQSHTLDSAFLAEEFTASYPISTTSYVLGESEPTTENTGLTYNLSNGNAIISGYTGSETNLVIPETLDGYPVISVLQNAFLDTAVESIQLPASCTYFSYFQGAYSLKEVLVADGNETFKSHEGVLYKYDEDNQMWVLYYYPIAKDDETYTVADFADGIFCDAFLDARHRLYEGEDPYLQTLYIEDCVGVDLYGIGYEMSRIRAEIIPADTNPSYQNVDHMLLSKDGTVLHQIPYALTGTVTVPETVKQIISYAGEYGSFTELIVPDTVEDIGDAAFWDCKTLETVSLSDSLKTLPGSLFQECPSLQNVKLPAELEEIGMSAFMDCKSLTNVDLPDTLKIIGRQAFASCISLEKIEIPDSVESLGISAFYCCQLKSILIPAGVTEFPMDCFYDCYNLTEIYYRGTEAQWAAIAVGTGNDYLANAAVYTDHVGSLPGDTCETHQFGEVQVVTPATCTEAGVGEVQCQECGEITTVEISATGHKYGSWKTTTAATCTSAGKKKHTCTVCGNTVSKTIAKLGHSYSSTWTIDKRATMTANGSKSHHCTRCNAKKDVTTIYKASTVKLSYTTAVYNGNVKSPKLIIKDSKGNTISSSNYTVKKATGRKNVGKYKYTITFKNQYKGTKTLYLTIKPKATAIKTPTASKKALTAKWTKVSKQATGYEIMVATNKGFTKNKKTVKVTSYKTTSKKITGLKSNTKYYVRVRTYKMVDGVKYTSAWSAVKTVKTK